jgi:hypothetical protein
VTRAKAGVALWVDEAGLAAAIGAAPGRA